MNFYILQGLYANQDDQTENLKIHQSLILNFLNKKVEIINGTKFINDSKSTNFHSVSSASERVKNALLIMHGITKNIPTSELQLSNEIKKIIIPNDMNLDHHLFHCEVQVIKSIFELEDILKKDFQRFETFLFSCGGSSFNDFENYIERGKFFKSIVKNLKGGQN